MQMEKNMRIQNQIDGGVHPASPRTLLRSEVGATPFEPTPARVMHSRHLHKMPCHISDLAPTPEDEEEMWEILNGETDWWKQQDEEMEREDARSN